MFTSNFYRINMFTITLRGPLNTLAILGLRFLGLLILYACLRLGFYQFNKALFPQVEAAELWIMMLGGIKFDVAALLYINSLYILLVLLPFPFKYSRLYQKIAKWLFIVTNSIGVALSLIDFVYYPFTLKRTTGTVFSQFANEDNLGALFLNFLLDYWFLLLFFVLLIFVMTKLHDRIIVQRPAVIRWTFYVVQVMSLVLVVFLFIGGVRGGWAHSTRPITLSNAGDYVQTPEEMNIVLNTPFSILKTLKAIALKEQHYFTSEALNSKYPVIHNPQAQAAFKPLNVVVLIMESFGKENVGALNRTINNGQYKGYTPFLDSLIGESFTFTRSYANGRKSIDALPSVISGIPSVGEPFVLSIYSGNKTEGLARLLGRKGYRSAFFHGAPNGSMGFSAFTKLAGFDHYFGKDEYANDQDFDGIWGIWDEPFMQFMSKEITKMPEPFFASFFSLSSHHPFKVPEKYAGVFPKGPLPVHEPTGYSDHALKEFFAKSAKEAWFKNTLFVLCADHATSSYLPEYNTAPNAFAIPIVFYYPGGNLKGQSDKLVQQIDILPTVLNYLQYDKPYFAFGFDAFAPETANFVVNNIGGTYNFFQGDYFMTHDGVQPLSVFNLKKDPFLKEDLLKTQKNTTDSLQQSLQAFIQQYNYRMIHNKLLAD